MRAGWMAAFDSFEHFQEYVDDILQLIEDYSQPHTMSSKVMDALEAADTNSDGNRLSTSINVSISDSVSRTPAGETPDAVPKTEPVHILSIAVRGIEDMDDNQMAAAFGAYCKLHRDRLFAHRIRRITFAALKK